MFRNAWSTIHWFIGIAAGLVLALVGLTGGLMSFEDELLVLANRDVLRVDAAGRAPLPVEELMAAIGAAEPGRRVQTLSISARPDETARVVFAPTDDDPAGPNGRRRGITRYVDPYTGALLGDVQGREFFRTVNDLHRRLLVDEAGKQVVGASTLSLVVLALSGLYLRWPRRVLDWRAWLTFSFAHRGRSFLWQMHAALGTWALLLYLLSALTGLYWSYDWYRDFLHAASGVPRPVRNAEQRPAGDPPPGRERRMRDGEGAERRARGRAAEANATGPAPAADAWRHFTSTVPGWGGATLRMPERPGAPIEITYLDADAPHDRARNVLRLGADGRVLGHERYADKPLAARLMASLLPLHTGAWFGLGGRLLMMVASLGMPLFAVTGWLLYLDRRRKKRARRDAAREAREAAPAAARQATPFLVAYASQSGTAERLAWHSARLLQSAGIPVTVRPLAALAGGELGRYERALFAVATFGDGQPPDGARGFARRVLGQEHPADLSRLRYGLLALGDRQYRRFCGFAHDLADWLHGGGAQTLFDTVEVDDGDPAALSAWQARLAALAGAPAPAPLPAETPFEAWRLAARTLLNPGSAGLPCFHLELQPASVSSPAWQAGDIAEVRVPLPGGGATVREYSIASIPDDGRLHLVVRQVRRADGSLGAGSGLLTEATTLGAALAVRIRGNPAFHAPPGDGPLILIGNGTGIAGLRAHLRAAARAGRRGHWLLFGERSRVHDFHFRSEIEAWQREGVLARVDLAFSRDPDEPRYVQHRLAEQAGRMREWVGGGASILVCGSAAGMAPAVDAALADILDREALERLAEGGRYRRDVY